MMAGRASFSSSSSSSSSSSFSYGWKYDVFLSFRGQDTRFGFTANLYKALRDKGIHTFFDDDELPRGDEITPSLLNAIEESRIAIPIFSHNYASSSFCLDELVNIIHCVKAKGRLVFPVFYDVDPSDVRHQRGSYGEALAKHVERFNKYDKEKLKDNMERLNNWKMALNQTANLSGEHFKLGNEKYEHDFIGKIVEVVSNTINRAPLHVADYPVGLESQVLKVISLLDVGSDDVVHMVGIHGIGGIGKTTLARAVYNLIADQFEGLCFLDDVREISIKHGIVHLQETLLSEIVGEKNIKLGSVNKGISIIKHRLHRKKVLLIPDDVDKLEQLRAIVGGLDWFGSGSRVIITTRDKHLLASHGVERKYELEVLNEKEALELLSWNAFKYNKVDPSYMDIINQAVTYASGLPLALEVIGSNLFGKSIEEWKSALDLYERIPHKDIQKILKVSFDALEEYQQSVFLDIACCFKGYGLAKVELILCACHGICPKFGIGVLVEKSLIKIQHGIMTLHDLIEDMGKEIVRQESPKEPGKRSRLWFPEDIVQVLERNTGTCDIEIINMDFPKFEEEVNWDGEAFKKMENLKTLIIRNGHFSKGPKHLPNSLRVLEWWEYPSESLPSDFHPKKLVILEMSKSRLRSHELLKVWKMFVNLRVLKFEQCEYITEIPNVSGVPNLEELKCSFCDNLIKIHESFGFLDKLKILEVVQCNKLRSFPPFKLTSLETLELSLCSSLESFPEILGKMENLRALNVMAIPIKELPFSIQNLTGLEIFILQRVQILQLFRIVMLPELDHLVISGCDLLGSSKQDEGEEHVSLMVPSNAVFLRLMGCNISDEFIPIILAWFSNVYTLNISESNFTILPACIKECRFLTVLHLERCKLLREIRGIPPHIEYLHVTDCPSLTLSCRSMLLNEELHEEGGDKMFHLDGTEIPEWFEHRSRELPISFWFRNKFPAISLCVVVELVNKRIDYMVYATICPKLIVNGSKVLSTGELKNSAYHVGGSIYIFDLKQIKFEDNVDEVLIENEWNHVVFTLEIMYPEELVIKQSGIHVFKQRSSMEDIRFTDPLLLKEEHRSDTGDSQRQFMQQQTNLALLEPHVGQGREWLSLLTPPALKSLNDNVNWDSNLMVSTRISSTPRPSVQEDQIVSNDESTLSDEGCHVMEYDQRTGKWQFCLCALFSSLLSLCSSSSSLDAA